MACKNFNCMSTVAVVWGSLEIMMFAGIIFGWHNIVYIYKDQGYFSHLCPVSNITENGQLNTSVRNSTFVYQVSSNDTGIYKQNVSIIQDGPKSLTCKEQYELLAIKSRSDCNEQDEQFNIIFSLSTFITGIMCIFTGALYDRFGTRKCRILSMFFMVCGLLFLINASPGQPYFLYPGFIFTTYGGYFLLITNLQIAGLVPNYRSMIMSAYCGSYDVSATMFLFFKLSYENYDISPNTCFIVMAVVYCVVYGFSTFCILPKSRIPMPKPSKYQFRPRIYRIFHGDSSDTAGNEGQICYPMKEITIDEFGSVALESPTRVSNRLCSDDKSLNPYVVTQNDNINIETDNVNVVPPSDNSNQDLLTKNIDADDTPATDELTEEKTTLVNEEDSKTNENIVSNGHPSTIQSTTRVPTFKKVLLSPLFLFLVFWISVHRLRGWMFIGVFNPWMSRLVCGDRSIVSHFTSFLSSTMFIGIFSAAFSGFVMDRKIKKKYESRKFERIHASIASFLLNCSVGLLLSICMTIPVVNLQYLTCLLFTLHRSFLYGPNSAFIANAFPMEHFGKLIGVTLTVSSLFGMLQNPLFLWIQGPLDKDPLVVNVIICVMILLTFIHPTYIWFYLRKKFSSRQKEKN